MAVDEIDRAGTEWLTVEDAASLKRRDVRTVQRWIAAGQIPALVLGRGIYLLRKKDVERFAPTAPGRPAKPAPARKPRRKQP